MSRAKGLPLWRALARVGTRMMFHDRVKLLGTLFGVIFAVVLSDQNAGTFLGLLYKNTMLPANAGADVWIVPAGTDQLAGGRTVSIAALEQARVTPGVAWAEPVLQGGASVARGDGGTEAVSVLGSHLRADGGRAAGPWNFVAGAPSALDRPDTMVFDDSQRDKLGALNLGDVREVNGRNVTAGGFTWGLVPFGPSLAFADFDLARELLHTPSDQTTYVLVGLAPGADADAVVAELARRVPEADVVTRKQLEGRVVRYVLTKTPIGVSLGSQTLFGLFVGFVIVALSMFSAVVDNLREFGTLKAIGATNGDLAKVLFVQAIVFAAFGSVLGLGIVNLAASGIRSPNLALLLPWPIFAVTAALMVVLCVAASSLALVRLRKLEPGMVFR